MKKTLKIFSALLAIPFIATSSSFLLAHQVAALSSTTIPLEQIEELQVGRDLSSIAGVGLIINEAKNTHEYVNYETDVSEGIAKILFPSGLRLGAGDTFYGKPIFNNKYPPFSVSVSLGEPYEEASDLILQGGNKNDLGISQLGYDFQEGIGFKINFGGAFNEYQDIDTSGYINGIPLSGGVKSKDGVLSATIDFGVASPSIEFHVSGGLIEVENVSIPSPSATESELSIISARLIEELVKDTNIILDEQNQEIIISDELKENARSYVVGAADLSEAALEEMLIEYTKILKENPLVSVGDALNHAYQKTVASNQNQEVVLSDELKENARSYVLGAADLSDADLEKMLIEYMRILKENPLISVGEALNQAYKTSIGQDQEQKISISDELKENARRYVTGAADLSEEDLERMLIEYTKIINENPFASVGDALNQAYEAVVESSTAQVIAENESSSVREFGSSFNQFLYIFGGGFGAIIDEMEKKEEQKKFGGSSTCPTQVQPAPQTPSACFDACMGKKMEVCEVCPPDNKPGKCVPASREQKADHCQEECDFDSIIDQIESVVVIC